MKKIIQSSFLILSLLSIESIAAEITSLAIEPKNIEVAKEFDVIINFTKESREKVNCGLDLIMEQGKVNSINIKDIDSPLRFTYQYNATGTYQIIVKPKVHLDGWKLIPPCEGNTQTLSVNASWPINTIPLKDEDNKIEQINAEQKNNTQNDVKVNFEAQTLVLQAMNKDLSNKEKAQLYLQALKIQLNYVPALLGLAMVRENEGYFDMAVKNLHLARSFLKDGFLADAIDEEMIALNKLKNKKNSKTQLIDVYGDMINKARIYLVANQISEAVHLLNEARIKDGKRWEAYILAGQIAYATNHQDDAKVLVNAGLMRIKDPDLRQKISSQYSKLD